MVLKASARTPCGGAGSRLTAHSLCHCVLGCVQLLEAGCTGHDALGGWLVGEGDAQHVLGARHRLACRVARAGYHRWTAWQVFSSVAWFKTDQQSCRGSRRGSWGLCRCRVSSQAEGGMPARQAVARCIENKHATGSPAAGRIWGQATCPGKDTCINVHDRYRRAGRQPGKQAPFATTVWFQTRYHTTHQSTCPRTAPCTCPLPRR